MLTVISPAKKLDETPRALPDGVEMTEPVFATEARALARVARTLTVEDLQRLMGISEPLARLNRDRFASFAKMAGPGGSFPAVHCFAGDTYQGLEARSLSAGGIAHALQHLRILSGLYGVLRPFDAIRPYRLEMGSRLETPKGADLYAFWGDKIAKHLRREAREAGTGVLVNCASVEYFSAANRPALGLKVINPVFLDGNESEAKVISFWAKRARGSMARFIVENALTDPDDLRGFTTGGYVWRADLSTRDRPVFLRSTASLQDTAA